MASVPVPRTRSALSYGCCSLPLLLPLLLPLPLSLSLPLPLSLSLPLPLSLSLSLPLHRRPGAPAF